MTREHMDPEMQREMLNAQRVMGDQMQIILDLIERITDLEHRVWGMEEDLETQLGMHYPEWSRTMVSSRGGISRESANPGRGWIERYTVTKTGIVLFGGGRREVYGPEEIHAELCDEKTGCNLDMDEDVDFFDACFLWLHTYEKDQTTEEGKDAMRGVRWYFGDELKTWAKRLCM